MAWIHIVHPALLSDQMLRTEHRDIRLLPAMLQRTLSSKKGLTLSEIPGTYSTTSMKFFFDKGQYIINRFDAIVIELRSRNIINVEDDEINYTPFGHVVERQFLTRDWTPTDEELETDMEAILQEVFEDHTKHTFSNIPLADFDWRTLPTPYQGMAAERIHGIPLSGGFSLL